MSAVEKATLLPQDVVRALTLASMLETVPVEQLKAEIAANPEQGVEWEDLVRACIIHLARYTLDLIGEVKDEAKPA